MKSFVDVDDLHFFCLRLFALPVELVLFPPADATVGARVRVREGDKNNFGAFFPPPLASC